jgi:hypothetical protein
MSEERCSKCGRYRPIVIADPTCPKGGYCEWRLRHSQGRDVMPKDIFNVASVDVVRMKDPIGGVRWVCSFASITRPRTARSSCRCRSTHGMLRARFDLNLSSTWGSVLPLTKKSDSAAVAPVLRPQREPPGRGFFVHLTRRSCDALAIQTKCG